MRGRDRGRLAPGGHRRGQAPELPQHLAEMKPRIGRARLEPRCLAEAEHRVDGASFPLVRAAAGEPLGERDRGHQRSFAFSRSTSRDGVSR